MRFRNLTVVLTPDATPASVAALLRRAVAEAAPDAGQTVRVLVVVPRDVSLSAVDLRILRREAVSLGVNIALITSSVGLRGLAAAAGISTFRRRGWAERVSWRRLGAEPKNRLKPTGSAETVAPYGVGLYSPQSPSGFRPVPFLRSAVHRTSPWWAELGLALVFLALLGILLLALATVIPEATVSLTPAAEPIHITVPLRAVQDAEADAEAGIVPARVLSAQVSGEASTPTTGRRLEPAAKARGEVVLVNRTKRPVDVLAGTVVATATGNNFRFATTADAPIVANGRATVPVEALLPGPSGNVRAGTITQVEGPLTLSLLVANDGATVGGTLAEAGVVTEEDKTRLEALLFEGLKKTALERLNERTGPGSFLPAESVTFMELSPTFTPFVGEVSPELNLSMSVQAVGLVVDSQAGNEVALTRLQGMMPPGSRLISDTVRFIPGSVVVEDASNVSFSTTAEGQLLQGIDASAARSAVLGLTPEKAVAALMSSLPLAGPPSVHLGPDWLPFVEPVNMPVLPWRIRVNVDWDAAAKIASR